MLAHLSRPTLRTAARALHSTPSRLAPGLAAKAGGQSVGEDAADTARKNTAVPVFVAAGAGIAGYIVYSQMSSRQQNHEEKKDAKHDQAKENVPAGSKERVGSRG